MSTDLYGVRVLALDPAARRVRVRVFVLYEGQPLPDDRSFFVRILWDEGDTRFGSGGSIGDAISVEQICSEAFVDSNAYRFVERFALLAARNEAPPAPGDSITFSYERGGSFGNEEQLPQADYDVFVTDARYLDHLVLGMSWGTTSYGTVADAITMVEAPRVPDLRIEARRLTPFPGPREEGNPYSLAISFDGRYLAVTSEAGDLLVYDTATWEERLLEEGIGGFPNVRFLPSLPVVVLQSGLASRAWDVATEQRVEAPPPRGRLRSRSGRYALDYGDEDELIFLDQEGQEERRIDTGQGCVEAAAFSTDESLVFTGGDEPGVKVWDAASGALVKSIEASASVGPLSPSPDGAWLLAALDRRRAGILRLADGQVVRQAEQRTYITDVAYTPDGRFVVVAQQHRNGEGGYLSVYEVGARWPDPPAPAPREADEPTPSGLDSALMRKLAEASIPRTPEAWTELLAAHARFLDSGGAEGSWEMLEVSGLILAVYRGAEAAEGKQAVLRYENLTGVPGRGARLAYADLSGVLAEGADFSGADLAGSAITDAHLRGARFEGANLLRADLSRADLRGADLRGADLRGADLENSDLTGADMTGARIGGIKLRGAKVAGLVGFGER